MKPPRLLVVQHNLDDPLDQLAAPLTAEGLGIETWFTQASAEPPRDLDGYDGVLTLGALASVNDASQPWIANERSLLTNAVGQGMPTLGICFGAQLLASVAGAAVAPTATPEVGWVQIAMTDDAASDPVLGTLGPEPHVFHWHYESFGTPPTGGVLGHSGQANQALRLGDRAWGVQFHIEVGPSTLNSWLGTYGSELERCGIDPDALRDETRRRWRAYARLATGLARAFAHQVRAFAP